MHLARRVHVPFPFAITRVQRLLDYVRTGRRRRRALRDLLGQDDPRLQDLGHCRQSLDAAVRRPDARAGLWYMPGLAERVYAQRDGGATDEAHDRAWRRY